ncbi:box A-binding factor-like [Musca domestica]|uniref:Box A-binding factor-like n=1 Tax=Musca domestica TaxID=7370 RepID=A0ABM3VC81_MUSDO|nr:box A-binding factor-like [Musca domestica]
MSSMKPPDDYKGRPHASDIRCHDKFVEEASSSTYQAFGGDIQPEPLSNNNHEAIDRLQYQQGQVVSHHHPHHPQYQFQQQLQQQQQQQHHHTSPLAKANLGQQQNPAAPAGGHSSAHKIVSPNSTTTKSAATATTAARRYSRFECTDELERRVSSGSTGGGATSVSGSIGNIFGRSGEYQSAVSGSGGDVGQQHQQQQQQQYGTGRSYAEARFKRGSVYGDTSNKYSTIGGSSSSGISGSYASGLDGSQRGTVNGYEVTSSKHSDGDGPKRAQQAQHTDGNTAPASSSSATGSYSTTSCTSTPLRQRLPSQAGLSDLSSANPGIFVGGIGGSNIYCNNIQTPSTFNSSNLGVNYSSVAGPTTQQVLWVVVVQPEAEIVALLVLQQQEQQQQEHRLVPHRPQHHQQVEEAAASPVFPDARAVLRMCFRK